jgi:hypothetical protein
MGLGLPIYRTQFGPKPPVGYVFKDNKQKILIPDIRLLRLLRKAYELKDEGCSLEDICKWIYINSKKRISEPLFSRLYHNRPIFKEIELPLRERQRLYKTAQAKADEEKGLYKDYQEEADEDTDLDPGIQGEEGAGQGTQNFIAEGI